jgi:hypothetical protein
LSRYSVVLLRVQTGWERLLLEVLFPVGLILIAAVPISSHGSDGEKVMGGIHRVGTRSPVELWGLVGISRGGGRL